MGEGGGLMSESGYEPPRTSAVFDPPREGSGPGESSGVAKTLGVLSIVFGSLHAVSDIWELAQGRGGMRFKMGSDEAKKVAEMDEVRHLNETVMPYLTIKAGLMLLLSIALI